VQSDWNQTNASQPSYIKNKPGINTAVTSYPTTASLNILTNGTDQTSALQTAFNNAAYQGIIMDFQGGGTITINGTLNCQGKTIVFRRGSMFNGTGTINNYYHESDMKQQCYATTLTINPNFCSMGKFSASWAWAGSGDYQPSAQWAIDTVVRNQDKIKLVYFPTGSYTLNNTLDIYSWNGTDYTFVSIYLVADPPQTGIATYLVNLNFSFRDKYGINFQSCKGSGMTNILVTGGFVPPFTNNATFYAYSFASYTDGVSRDSRYSPYSGVVIDAYSPSAPGDGGYPGKSTWYRGSGTLRGSTGVTIRNCFMTNWVCCIITSPNGSTQNAELVLIENCNFANYKCCIAGCQAQEKLNEVRHIQAWGTGHTFFCNQTYGAASPGNWYIEGVNLAGFNVQFLNGTSGGFFPSYFKNIYAEQIGKIGVWSGSISDCMEDSLFDLAVPSFVGYFPDWAFSGQLRFKNSTFRYYENLGHRVSFQISGRSNLPTFDGCKFEDVPYVFSGQEIVGTTEGLGNQLFINCTIGNGAGGFTLGPQADYVCQPAEIRECYCYGSYRIFDSIRLSDGTESILHVKHYQPLCKMLIGNSTSTVTVAANVATVTPAGGLSGLAVGDHIVLGQQMIGTISSIGGSTFNVQYVNPNIVNGTYNVYVLGNLNVFTFMGDCTSGSATINNVVVDKGQIIDGAFLQIPGFYNGFYQQARILSHATISGVTSITMDRNCSQTGTSVYFNQCSIEKTVQQLNPGRAISSSEIFGEGSMLLTNFPTDGGWIKKITTTTGYYSGSPQATWVKIGDYTYGTYTPTVTNQTNVNTATGQPSRWMRIGNIVFVSGHVNIKATAPATLTAALVTPPIPSTLATDDLSGTFAAAGGLNIAGSVQEAVSPTNKAIFSYTALDTNADDYYFNFAYVVH
jgi:hypothetical protein